jgi:hypothetical protein
MCSALCSCIYNVFACIFTFIYDVLRTIPVLALFGAFCGLVGSILTGTEVGGLITAFDLLGLDAAALVGQYYVPIFLGTCLVNAWALLVIIPATGACREMCFSRRANCCCRCVQLLMGEIPLGILFFLVLCTWTVNFLVACALIPGSVLLSLTMGACVSGSHAIGGLVNAITNSSLKKIMVAHELENVCHIGGLKEDAGYYAAVGAMICCFGQVILLVSATNAFVRVQLQPRLAQMDDDDEESRGLLNASKGNAEYLLEKKPEKA